MLKKKLLVLLLSASMAMTMLAGCGSNTDKKDDTKTEASKDDASEAKTDIKDAKEPELEDGTYKVAFNTDSGMFHENPDYNDGKATLTVKDGKMTVHITLNSKNIVQLFLGSAEDAQKDGADLIDPSETTEITYSDGSAPKEVYSFDVPVPTLDDEFDLALVGTKGKWYDHKVSVKDPVKTGDVEETTDDTDKKEDSSDKETAEKADASKDEKTSDDKKSEGKKLEDLKLEDGTYEFDVTLTGGTGRATVESPAKVEIKDKEATAIIIWSSPNYDYMIVDGEKYEPVNKDGNSTFEIPVTVFDAEMEVTADTVAMSTPHEIDYTLNFDSSSMKKEEK